MTARAGLAGFLGLAALASCLFVGIRGTADQMRVAVSARVEWAIPPGMVRQARIIRSRVGPDAPVLLMFPAGSDFWVAGLWQRALYPTPLFLLNPKDVKRPPGRMLREERGLRYAMTISQPPELALLRDWEKLPPDEGSSEVIFGELAP